DAGDLVVAARAHGRVALACDGTPAAGGGTVRGIVLAAADVPPVYLPVAAGGAPPAELAELLRDTRVEEISHDWKRDLLLLGPAWEGVTPAFDVMVASYLLEASATHRLEDLAADVLGVNLPAFRDTPEALANGAALLLELRERFGGRLHECAMEHLF